MKLSLSFLLFLISLSCFSQNIDSNIVKKNIIGKWKLMYSIKTDSLGNYIDTIPSPAKDEEFYGLHIEKRMAVEIIKSKECILVGGHGEWVLKILKDNTYYFNPNCSGLILCNNYTIENINKDYLMLKHCKPEYPSTCQIDYLKRKNSW